MTSAMPRPAADTAEQTVSAIIRSSRQGFGGIGYFVPSILHLPDPTGPWLRSQIRDISGSAPPQVPVRCTPPGPVVRIMPGSRVPVPDTA
ncbi:hypothetical protein GCM10027073_00250 [Streptomyces chlorus]